MTIEEISEIGSALGVFLLRFRRCFSHKPTFRHFGVYVRGLLSDLPRKSVEPIALAAGSTVRTLQLFLTFHRWDAGAMRDEVQRRIAQDHLPAPGSSERSDPLGVVGWTDETSVAKKGDKTPGVQRQHCGATGKIDNCIVTVHLACRHGDFMALLDSDLFLPEESWNPDRQRCRKAHIPDSVVYRSKWRIALEQVDRSRSNGIRLDWMSFDEWYGGKPGFLLGLDQRGQLFVGEVPRHWACFPTLPRYHSTQAPHAAKRADHAACHGKPFRGKRRKEVRLTRKTLPDQLWHYKAGRVHLSSDGTPTEKDYWLIWARNRDTREDKYFVSNAPPSTAVEILLRVAFTRAGVEHVFRVVKTEIGFDHFEGRSYVGLMRHMTLCQVVFLFLAAHTDRIRKKKSGHHAGASGQSPQHPLPFLDDSPVPTLRI
jgi:SRSO17 transposase